MVLNQGSMGGEEDLKNSQNQAPTSGEEVSRKQKEERDPPACWSEGWRWAASLCYAAPRET